MPESPRHPDLGDVEVVGERRALHPEPVPLVAPARIRVGLAVPMKILPTSTEVFEVGRQLQSMGPDGSGIRMDNEELRSSPEKLLAYP